MFYYKSVKDDSAVINKLLELASLRPTEGQDKLYQRLRLQGYPWNKKRVRRIYLKLGLNLRRKTKKRIPARVKEPLTQMEAPNQTWSMDFMSDALDTGRRFRVLNIIDDFNRKAVAVEAEFSFPAIGVIQVLRRAFEEHGKPEKIRVDNGPEFTSLELTEWCRIQNVQLWFIQPGRPMQNGYIERFNRTYRQDVLDAYLFAGIDQVRVLSEKWMEDYNFSRPHEALGGKTPRQAEELFSSKQACFDEKQTHSNQNKVHLYSV
jgi:putative transposase